MPENYDNSVHPVIKTAISKTVVTKSIVIILVPFFIVPPMGSLPRKRPLVGRQYPFPEYQSIDKEQHTEKASCYPFRTKKRDPIHIPAAKKAAQDTEIQRIEQQESNRYVVKHCTEQFALRVADVPYKCCEQIPCTKSRQRTRQAEDAELHVCHAVSVDIYLNAKPHEVDLFEYTDNQGIQEMCTLVNEVVSDQRGQNADVLSRSF